MGNHWVGRNKKGSLRQKEQKEQDSLGMGVEYSVQISGIQEINSM